MSFVDAKGRFYDSIRIRTSENRILCKNGPIDRESLSAHFYIPIPQDKAGCADSKELFRPSMMGANPTISNASGHNAGKRKPGNE